MKDIGGFELTHFAPGDKAADSAKENASAKPFTIWKPSQFIAYTAPTDAVILGDSVVERGKWTSLVGIGGLGKTRLALYLAVCQIVGRNWCDLKVYGKPLRWLILSTENGLRRWKTDLGAMLASLDTQQRAAVEENLSIMAMLFLSTLWITTVFINFCRTS